MKNVKKHEKKKDGIGFLVQLILILILLVLIKGAIDENIVIDDRLKAFNDDIQELNYRVESSKKTLEIIRSDLEESKKRIADNETWLKEHEEFIEIWTND